jgi:adenylosuccinate synthase
VSRLTFFSQGSINTLCFLSFAHLFRQGWTEDITKARSRSQLPKAAQDYLAFLEKESGIKATWVGVGPGREGMVTV